jgi:hypothetical protein
MNTDGTTNTGTLNLFSPQRTQRKAGPGGKGSGNVFFTAGDAENGNIKKIGRGSNLINADRSKVLVGCMS